MNAPTTETIRWIVVGIKQYRIIDIQRPSSGKTRDDLGEDRKRERGQGGKVISTRGIFILNLCG